MTSYVVIVTDPENLGYNRSPWNRNINVQHPNTAPKFSVMEQQLQEYNGWWICETKEWAEIHAESLAKRYPNKVVKVAQIITEFQSETPKVIKKSVSEKGVLPT